MDFAIKYRLRRACYREYGPVSRARGNVIFIREANCGDDGSLMMAILAFVLPYEYLQALPSPFKHSRPARSSSMLPRLQTSLAHKRLEGYSSSLELRSYPGLCQTRCGAGSRALGARKGSKRGVRPTGLSAGAEHEEDCALPSEWRASENGGWGGG